MKIGHAGELLRNAGPYQLPQHVSRDRRRARRATLELIRRDFQVVHDPGIEGYKDARLPPFLAAWEGASSLRRLLTKVVGLLPPKEAFITELPPDARWDGAKEFRHGAHAGSILLRQAYLRLTNLDLWPRSEAAYERLLGTIPPPRAKDRWRDDRDFAQQRLTGVNPMAIRRCTDTPTDAIARAADRVLTERHGTTWAKAMEQGRIYRTDFPLLWEEPVQAEVMKGVSLAAPTSLFYASPGDELHPLAIQLRPAYVEGPNPVFSPLDWESDWLLARAHVQAADAHYHEALYHLLETHLMAEVFAIYTRRELHDDHPVHQLLAPHFEYTLSINEQARKNLLADHGQIAKCMAARNSGGIQLSRLYNATWSIDEHSLRRDLERRDVFDLPQYHYRDDALEIWGAMHEYVTGIVQIWYPDDTDVAADPELAAWSTAIADPAQGRLAGFPAQIGTRGQLAEVVTEIMFRSSAQHAAVNNGQFGSYGWVPNAPGAIRGDLPAQESSADAPARTEKDYWKGLPDRNVTLNQLGMVWLLSEPTERSLLRSGECPAFAPDRCFAAYETVGRFRQRLRALADALNRRNEEAEYDYTYLEPPNIDRSIAI
jgi:hypothetical protein